MFHFPVLKKKKKLIALQEDLQPRLVRLQNARAVQGALMKLSRVVKEWLRRSLQLPESLVSVQMGRVQAPVFSVVFKRSLPVSKLSFSTRTM